jgi:hypothetical protein
MATPFKFGFFPAEEIQDDTNADATTSTVDGEQHHMNTRTPTATSRNHVEPCKVLEVIADNVLAPDESQLLRVHNKYDLRVISGASVQPRIQGNLGQVVARTDVQAGVYEGGFKLWECAVDLMHYVAAHPELLLARAQGSPTQVLELGCGHGVPGIQCLRLASDITVTFQDLNGQVLEETTVRNVMANGGKQALQRSSFVAGDWTQAAQVLGHHSFDLILMSETVYSESNFGVLHDLIDHALATQGCALVAGKRYYFGVGGGIDSFAQFVENAGVFRCIQVETMDDGGSNLRDTVKLVRR